MMTTIIASAILIAVAALVLYIRHLERQPIIECLQEDHHDTLQGR